MFQTIIVLAFGALFIAVTFCLVQEWLDNDGDY